MSRWAFRFLLFFILVLYIQPQNRFYFLYNLHLGDVTAVVSVGLHCISAATERRPFIRFGPATILSLLIIVFSMISLYSGPLQSSSAWNREIDMIVKACVTAILIEAMAFTPQRVWAVNAATTFAVLWWVKAGVRLSASGATYAADRVMGAAVSLVENPNAMGFFLSAYIPSFYYFSELCKSKLWKYGYLVLSLVSIFIVLQTGSRTGFLALCVAGIFIMWRLGKEQRIALIAGGIGLYFVLGLVSPGNIERIKTIDYAIKSFLFGHKKAAVTLEEQSAVDRYYKNKHTWELIKRYPIMGAGISADYDLIPPDISMARGKVHCEILIAGRRLGFIGMAMYIASIWIPISVGQSLRKLARYWWPQVASLGWLFIAQSCVFIVGGLFSPSAWNYPEMILAGSASAMMLNLAPQLAELRGRAAAGMLRPAHV